MTTKDQERKALEQIKKIVAGLGEDSYIATAFAGCFEDAENNIADDAAYSMKDRVESLSKENWNKRKEIVDLKNALKEMEERANHAEELFNAKVQSADKWCAKYHENDDNWTKCYNQMVEKYNEADTKAEALELENMKLKAKLYDMMVGA